VAWYERLKNTPPTWFRCIGFDPGECIDATVPTYGNRKAAVTGAICGGWNDRGLVRGITSQGSEIPSGKKTPFKIRCNDGKTGSSLPYRFLPAGARIFLAVCLLLWYVDRVWLRR